MTRALVLALALVAACRTTTTSSPPNLEVAVVMRAEAVFAWEVREGGALVGHVVRFATSETRPKTWYSIRNAHQQELGLVDADGRAWRYRPHQREPEWLGTGTVAKGARLVLGAGEGAEMIAIDAARLSELRSKSGG